MLLSPHSLVPTPHFVQAHPSCAKSSPRKRNAKQAKWLSEEALQRAEKREAKGKEEKERYTHLNAEFQRIARRGNKVFFIHNHKEDRGCGFSSLEELRECVTVNVYVSPDSLRLRAGGKTSCTDSAMESNPRKGE